MHQPYLNLFVAQNDRGTGGEKSPTKLADHRGVRPTAGMTRIRIMLNPRKMLRNFALGSAALALAGGFAAAVPASSAPNYDGLWSVVIITEKGTCDRAYRYPIRIAHGTLL